MYKLESCVVDVTLGSARRGSSWAGQDGDGGLLPGGRRAPRPPGPGDTLLHPAGEEEEREGQKGNDGHGEGWQAGQEG